MGRAAVELTGGPVLFVWGPLRHPPLLEVVVGRAAGGQAAVLPGYRVAGHRVPGLIPAEGPGVEGVLLTGLTADEVARIAFHGHVSAWARRPVRPSGGGQAVLADVGTPEPDDRRQWSLSGWQRREAALAVALAEDIMALYGRQPAAAVAARRQAMAVRADSRLRAAAAPAPAAVRRAAVPGDVSVAGWTQPYARFFAVEEYDLAFRRFDGSLSDTVNRAVWISCDAVTILPYDPVRDRVMVIEQFRAGPLARGDRNAWSLEAIAGRIDPGETPEGAGRREALEEAGLKLGALLPVAAYYPSPGGKSEFLHSFVGLADLPDDGPRLGGVADEAEDIRAHVLPFDRLTDLVATGEAGNAPLILSALWLQRERPRLRTA